MRELARSRDGVWVTCAGRSMEPTIKLGERVRVRTCARIRAGDVILFAGARGCVLHRVVLALPGVPWFAHIGDAGSPDGPGIADKRTVIGRADVPRQCPSVRARAAGLRRLARAAWRVFKR